MTIAARSTADTFLLGDDLPVRRLGYGTMQLTGPGHWGPPADIDNAIRVLRHAVNLGVNHLDTADAYGPHTVEDLIRRALYPYPDDLVIATKGGLTRHGPNLWTPCGQPAYLRQCVELSLRRLSVDRIDVYYLHRIDPAVPLADQLGTLSDLQTEGKIRHLGLSKVTVAQLQQAQALAEIVAVQNRLTLHGSDPALDYAERSGMAYVAYAPLHAGGAAAITADPAGQTSTQAALAWLLNRSPCLLAIPGTQSLVHLAENCAAAAATSTCRLSAARGLWLHDQYR